MRKIVYIAPVEGMRGNLSGKDDLAYKDGVKGVYEAARGISAAVTQVAANNYTTRYIGNLGPKLGRKFFSVKRRFVYGINKNTKVAMAALGGAAALAKAYIEDLSAAVPVMQTYAEFQKETDSKLSINQFATKELQPMLYGGDASRTITYGDKTWNAVNPWKNEQATVKPSEEIMDKFDEMLSVYAGQ